MRLCSRLSSIEVEIAIPYSCTHAVNSRGEIKDKGEGKVEFYTASAAARVIFSGLNQI